MADSPDNSLGAIASVSHELRAPLHAIVGLSELLIDGQLGERERELATAIHREGQALQFIIDDLLDLSKINAGKMTLLNEAFSPRAMLDEVATMFRPPAVAKSLTLSLAVDDGLPLAVRGDRHRLRQVLVNLVSNAVKYTDDGSITITADLRADAGSTGDDGEMSLHVEVADTGPGIPEEALADLFAPFEQARKRDGIKGTGLGLSITRQLAELMNGAISLDTSPAGSTFTIRVPVRQARRKKDQLVATRSAVGARVLIVDDADVNRMVARSQLERLGHEPVEASNGADALALLASEHFDAVLMDWHMPHQDGLETVRLYHLWADEHGAVPPPIIMMTADVSANARQVCAEAGTSDFLPKPVTMNDLDRCLSRWIGEQEQEPGSQRGRSSASQRDAARHATPRQESTPAIDRAILDQMSTDLGSSDAVALVIATFIEDAAQRRIALPSDGLLDPELGRMAAHTLKSTAAMLGAQTLSAACQNLESQLHDTGTATQSDLATFNQRLDAASRELQTIAAELTQDQLERPAMAH